MPLCPKEKIYRDIRAAREKKNKRQREKQIKKRKRKRDTQKIISCITPVPILVVFLVPEVLYN